MAGVAAIVVISIVGDRSPPTYRWHPDRLAVAGGRQEVETAADQMGGRVVGEVEVQQRTLFVVRFDGVTDPEQLTDIAERLEDEQGLKASYVPKP